MVWSAGLDGLGDEVRDDLVGEQDIVDLVGRGPVEVARLHADVPRLRPILVALAARAAGASSVDGEAQYAAEVLSAALRVHDLALGREGGLRRRIARRAMRPAVDWLSAQALAVRALELTRVTRAEVMGEAVDVLRAFSDAQGLSRAARGRVATRTEWMEHADAHAGALLRFCCRAGAHLARADAPTAAALGRYGRHLGRVWHVVEDLSLLRREPELVLVRVVAGRPMLPLVLAAERDPAVAVAWAALSRAPSIQAAARLAGLALDAGATEAATAPVAVESWAARRALASLPDTTYRARLDRLAEELLRSVRA